MAAAESCIFLSIPSWHRGNEFQDGVEAAARACLRHQLAVGVEIDVVGSTTVMLRRRGGKGHERAHLSWCAE
jgi:hypothetical protein